MYIQNGEWDIILKVRFGRYVKTETWKSLRFLIISLLVLFAIIPAVIMEAVILTSYEKRAVEVRTAEIQNQCTILCNQLSQGGYPKVVTTEAMNAEITQLSNIYNGRVLLIDQAYHILKDTYDMDEGKRIVSGDVTGCMSGKGTTYYDSKNRYIEVTSPIMDAAKEKVIGVMLVSVSTDSIAESKGVLGGKANVVAVVAVIIALVLAIGLGFLMVRPFQRITRRIEAVTEGYHADYLHENAYTETKILSEAFNKMLGRLKAQDDSRQEFVSNVSHELKTPLTSMKVLADSLLIQENVPTELYREFMGDLSEEIERENKIINDLLSLVKMDKTASNMNIQSVSMNELVEKILKRLRPIATKQNVEVVYQSFRPVTAEIDEVKLSLAITNLVENAIKYNREGGWVHVTLNADHKFCNIEVADSGIGIAQEETEHIFERFYRVDKSHSREIGGTGLGLSIARNAVVMHRGAIKVFSQPGEGTTFTIRIPLVYVAPERG